MNYDDILVKWGIEQYKIRGDLKLTGSPNRKEMRVAIEDRHGNLFVLEQIDINRLENNKKTAELLFELFSQGLDCTFYFPLGYHSMKRSEAKESADRKSFVARNQREFYLLRRYLEGDKLKRPEYIFSGNIAVEAAGFLSKLRMMRINEGFNFGTFYLHEFLNEFSKKLQNCRERIDDNIFLIIDKISKEMKELEENVPFVFAHGDFHAMNIIWSKEKIKSVIDWEFCGYKTECYDMAMFIGCMGFESPFSIKRTSSEKLIRLIAEKEIVSKLSLEYLNSLIIAIRFGWLSLWMAGNDEEMIDEEMVYIEFLYNEKPFSGMV